MFVEKMMEIEICEMTIDEYDEVIALWKDTEGVILDDDDSKKSIDRYLKRNPRLSFVARANGAIVGTALCGHDGRRGILRHMAVKPEYRNQHIAQQLIAKCLSGLSIHGVSKCNAFVLEENISGQSSGRVLVLICFRGISKSCRYQRRLRKNNVKYSLNLTGGIQALLKSVIPFRQTYTVDWLTNLT